MVDGDAAVHALGAMVANDHHRAIRRQERDDLAKPGIQPDVVVANSPDKWAGRIVFRVQRVVEAPEAVVDAIGGDLDIHEEVPWLRGHQVSDDLQVLFRDLVDLTQQRGLVLSAEVGDIHPVVADQALDLRLQGWRPCVWSVGVGREKARDQMAVDRTDGIRLGHSDDDAFPAGPAEGVPDAIDPDIGAIGDAGAEVAAVGPVAKAIDS